METQLLTPRGIDETPHDVLLEVLDLVGMREEPLTHYERRLYRTRFSVSYVNDVAEIMDELEDESYVEEAGTPIERSVRRRVREFTVEGRPL